MKELTPIEKPILDDILTVVGKAVSEYMQSCAEFETTKKDEGVTARLMYLRIKRDSLIFKLQDLDNHINNLKIVKEVEK